MISQLHDYLRKAYQSSLGRPRREVTTPALILDLDGAPQHAVHGGSDANASGKLRPHTKVQKCVELARLQIDAGAIGICCATVWEAIVMSRGGIADVLVANEVGGKQKIEAWPRPPNTGD